LCGPLQCSDSFRSYAVYFERAFISRGGLISPMGLMRSSSLYALRSTPIPFKGLPSSKSWFSLASASSEGMVHSLSFYDRLSRQLILLDRHI